MIQVLRKQRQRDIFDFFFSLTLFLLVLAVDQISKSLALSSLSLHYSISLFETSFLSFYWTLVTNTGAAWGMFAFSPHILLFVRAVVILLLLIFWMKSQRSLVRLCIAAIIGGAISNIIDFFYRGAVIDFIHVRIISYDYPVFNIADSVIFVSTVVLIFCLSYKKQKKQS